MGLDQRSYSPAVLDKIVSANAEEKSAGKARKMLAKLAEISISISEIMDLSGMIGRELEERLQQQAQAHATGSLRPQYAEAPRVVAVGVDGGRLMTRAEGGRGVHGPAWKETKNGCLLSLSSSPSQRDPHPELPACFADRQYVKRLVQTIHSASGPSLNRGTGGEIPAESALAEPGSVAAVTDEAPASPLGPASKRWQPQRLVRSCLSSMVCSDDFGPLLASEAQRRGFYQAERRALLGDGQEWNWTLHANYFSDFVPITDFVHPLGYLYEAAKILAPADPWPVYLRAATACWQGRVTEVIAELQSWRAANPAPQDEKLPDEDPRSIIKKTATYLTNNRERMDYPTYRRLGLPTSTSMIESMIKEMNYRVKGTEKFWNRPEGAEAILQLRAAALGDDDQLSTWILNRPGNPFYRRSTPLTTPA